MEIGNTSYVIGELVRTIRINVLDWGVYAVVRDKTKNSQNARYGERNFRKTKNYPTIEDNIERAMKYYRSPQSSIDFIKKCYKLKNN